jgi:hypothetical protein
MLAMLMLNKLFAVLGCLSLCFFGNKPWRS